MGQVQSYDLFLINIFRNRLETVEKLDFTPFVKLLVQILSILDSLKEELSEINIKRNNLLGEFPYIAVESLLDGNEVETALLISKSERIANHVVIFKSLLLDFLKTHPSLQKIHPEMIIPIFKRLKDLEKKEFPGFHPFQSDLLTQWKDSDSLSLQIKSVDFKTPRESTTTLEEWGRKFHHFIILHNYSECLEVLRDISGIWRYRNSAIIEEIEKLEKEFLERITSFSEETPLFSQMI